MPRYTFTIEELHTEDEIELADDDAAWSQLVTWCGEILKDEDGKLPAGTEIKVSVARGRRQVANIRVIASRPAKMSATEEEKAAEISKASS